MCDRFPNCCPRKQERRQKKHPQTLTCMCIREVVGQRLHTPVFVPLVMIQAPVVLAAFSKPLRKTRFSLG